MRGRPRVKPTEDSQTVRVVFPESVNTYLIHLAEQRNTTKSEIVREAIAQYLELQQA